MLIDPREKKSNIIKVTFNSIDIQSIIRSLSFSLSILLMKNMNSMIKNIFIKICIYRYVNIVNIIRDRILKLLCTSRNHYCCQQDKLYQLFCYACTKFSPNDTVDIREIILRFTALRFFLRYY